MSARRRRTSSTAAERNGNHELFSFRSVSTYAFGSVTCEQKVRATQSNVTGNAMRCPLPTYLKHIHPRDPRYNRTTHSSHTSPSPPWFSSTSLLLLAFLLWSQYLVLQPFSPFIQTRNLLMQECRPPHVQLSLRPLRHQLPSSSSQQLNLSDEAVVES